MINQMLQRLAVSLIVACACATAGPPAVGPSISALLDEARAARASGDDARARAILDAALRIEPAQDEARLELVDTIVAGGGDAETAARLLDDPARRLEGARAERLRGMVLEARGDDVGAAAAYARSLWAAPDPDVRHRRATVLLRLGRSAEAISDLERACGSGREDASCHARLADLYEQAGRVKAAEAELLEVARLSPGRTAPLVRLARFYGRTGQPEKERAAEEQVRTLEGRERVLRPLLPSRR